MQTRALLELFSINKSFSKIPILKDVNFTITAGKVMALTGANGAGKSTLMRIINGIYQPDSGTIHNHKGVKVKFPTSHHAIKSGIAMIHQELTLIQSMRVYENIFLGREFVNKAGIVIRQKMIAETQKYLDQLEQSIDPTARLSSFSFAQQKMIEIAKALSLNAQIIIMDEPTDALTDKETKILFGIIDHLKKQDKGIVFISHRLKEIFQICDDITVLRDGQVVHTGDIKDINEDDLIHHMVGRTLEEQYPYTPAVLGEPILKVQNLFAQNISNVSFQAHNGEVLGIAGLMGAGRTELAKAIYGSNPIQLGSLTINHKLITKLKSPYDGVQASIGYVTEDRKHIGLIQFHSVKHNMLLSGLAYICHALGIINTKKEEQKVKDYISILQIKTQSINTPVFLLSGGNQQKISIAKSLLAYPQILILDEPTRGVDIGARYEIYSLINKLKSQGMCIILISSDMPELLGISDRILTMSKGQIVGSFTHKTATQENILKDCISSPQ